MQQIWPTQTEISILEAYQVDMAKYDSGFLRINMVSSLDGAVVINGRSGGLGSPIDKQAFHTMRSLADVILAGASTVRKEHYHPVQFPDEVIEQRLQRGQDSPIPIAIVSVSGQFDWDDPFFRDATVKPIIFTIEKTADRLSQYENLATIVASGSDSVNGMLIKRTLINMGYKHILCEGGPHLNATLLEAGVIDELCLTINPVITQSTGPRLFAGTVLSVPADFSYTHINHEMGMLLLRCTKIL